MSSRVGCVWPVEHQLWLPIQFSLLPEPCKEFNSICIFKAEERFSLAANAQNCANHLSRWGNPSPCFCIRPWFQKMSPDCLRSLRTWMSSYWNVNVDGSQDKGPIFSFHQFEEEPKGRSEQRQNLRKQGFSEITMNSVALFLHLDPLKSGLLKIWPPLGNALDFYLVLSDSNQMSTLLRKES